MGPPAAGRAGRIAGMRSRCSFDTLAVHGRGLPVEDILRLPLDTAHIERIQEEEGARARLRRLVTRMRRDRTR